MSRRRGTSLQRWLGELSDIEVVRSLEDGLQAAASIEQLRPDVAFLDIQMPGLSGLEVAAQLEQETAPLIVFVTAYDEHAVKAFDLNAVDYLLKPYDKERLLKAVARVRDRSGRSAIARAGGGHGAGADGIERAIARAGRRAAAADRQQFHRLAGSGRQLRSRPHREPEVSIAADVAGPADAAWRAALRAYS